MPTTFFYPYKSNIIRIPLICCLDDLAAEVIPSNKRMKSEEAFVSVEKVVGVGNSVGDSSCTQCFEIA